MELFWLPLLYPLLLFSSVVDDPVVRRWFGDTEQRSLECEHLSQQEAHERFPAAVPKPSARGTTFFDRDAVVCRPPMVRPGLRDARDELVLSSLQSELPASARGALAAAPAATRWFVEAHYPDLRVAAKVQAASAVALQELGAAVHMRAPLPAAGDLEVLHGLPLDEKLPLACERMWREGSLTDDDALLSLALLRERETLLHAGVCQTGRWRWLR
ncbi:MAG: hypothetical protein ACO3JL_04190 [Myxococcota bacterium]|jgi:hypothetical protein